jgi:hypothetical protein
MKAAAVVTCVKCHDEIEGCAFCEEPDCKAPVCLQCLAFALKTRRRQARDQGD